MAVGPTGAKVRALSARRMAGGGAVGKHPETVPPPDPGAEDDWFPELQAGNLAVRLAGTAADLDAVQALRYRVFYDEMTARPSPEMALRRRDFDRFDAICDHLVVTDVSRDPGADRVVGTYRLLRGQVGRQYGRFYTTDEYEIGCLTHYPGEILELGRSCVDANYRTLPTMQLLWRGIAAYAFHHDVEMMFGCASLPGTDPARLAMQLSYLYHFHLAPPAIRPEALVARRVDMDMMPPKLINPREALMSLPPLIKGYLRLGGFVGDGAVVDHQFDTTDVCVVVKTDLITERYHRHYYERRVGGGRGEATQDTVGSSSD